MPMVDTTHIRLARVVFASQAQAESMRPPQRAALISITDPGGAQAQLRPGWERVLRCAFNDLDPLRFPDRQDEDDAGLAMNRQQVLGVARFVLQAASSCRRLVVHCRYGVSRSAAVAKAVAEHFGLPFPLTQVAYNGHLHALVRQALGAVEADH